MPDPLRLSQFGDAAALDGTELVLVSQPSSSVTITAGTISAAASDNSLNDSGSGFVAAGFTSGKGILIAGFTGDTGNNGYAVIESVAVGKIVISGITLVDDAAGESVTITQLDSKKTDAQAIADLASAASPIGRHSIPIMAGAMLPSIVDGCGSHNGIVSAANQPDIWTLDFPDGASRYAQFAIPMPKSWNEGTVTFRAVWSHPATTTNFDAVWQLQGVAVGNDDAIAAAYGTPQTVTDTGGTTSDLYISPESSAITVAGSPAAEDVVFFRVARLGADGSDNLAVNARLHAIILYYTTDAGNDA
jgi:hypothetical protein